MLCSVAASLPEVGVEGGGLDPTDCSENSDGEMEQIRRRVNFDWLLGDENSQVAALGPPSIHIQIQIKRENKSFGQWYFAIESLGQYFVLLFMYFNSSDLLL